MIHAVIKQDEGVYRCVAGNDLGVTQAVATITVTGNIICNKNYR